MIYATPLEAIKLLSSSYKQPSRAIARLEFINVLARLIMDQHDFEMAKKMMSEIGIELIKE